MQLGKECLLVVCAVLASTTEAWAAPMGYGDGQLFAGDPGSVCAGSADPTFCVSEIISALCPDTACSLGVMPGLSAVGSMGDAGWHQLPGLPVEDLMFLRWLPGLAAVGAVAWLCFSLGIQSVLHVGRGMWLSRLSVLTVEPRAPPH